MLYAYIGLPTPNFGVIGFGAVDGFRELHDTAYMGCTKHSIHNLLTVDGKGLTDARLAAKFSQEQVAQRIGINKAKLSRWEQSQLMPSLEHIDALVAVLGTYSFVRLNGKAVLTAEEIEAVRKLREG